MAFCKLGTSPSAPAKMQARFFPLFRVIVTAMPRQFVAPGMQINIFSLAETN